MYRNAIDAGDACRTARVEFEKHHLPTIASVKAKYSSRAGRAVEPSIKFMLEAHIRNYLINALLAALNWNIRPARPALLPNLVPESPVDSLRDHERRHIDYLGVDRQNDAPLLIVETKRPGSPPPKFNKPENPSRASKRPVNPLGIAKIILAGLNGTELAYEWTDWLRDLKDYFASVHAHGVAPLKVVITDGCWCVVFKNPKRSFLDSANSVVDDLLIIEDDKGAGGRPWIYFEGNFRDLYDELEYYQLASESRLLIPEEIGFHLPHGAYTVATHGLRLKYSESPDFYTSKPRIQVLPIVFLRQPGSAWSAIDSHAEDLYVPIKEENIPEHLEEVGAKAEELKAEISALFASAPKWLSLIDHYSDDDSFAVLPGVRQIGHTGEFLVVTGDHLHYLQLEPSVPGCPYHDWTAARDAGRQSPHDRPVSSRSVDPRASFPSPGAHHRAHIAVERTKSSRITPRKSPSVCAIEGICPPNCMENAA